MIEVKCSQRSETWRRSRLGIPTSSQFHRLITPKKLTPAKSTPYMHELLAELFTGEEQGKGSNEWMTRGTGMEDEAVKWYELMRDVQTDEVGFCLTDDRLAGCSPDRLVGDSGGLEIKCPKASLHIGWLLGEGAHEHRCQVQGSMWVTGREWWDLEIYSPVLPSVLTRHEPDPEWLEAFVPAIEEFQEGLEVAKTVLLDRGLEIPAPPRTKEENFEKWLEGEMG